VNVRPKASENLVVTGRCPFCGRPLELSVSSSSIRIFRCVLCGLFGQAITPTRKYRPRQTEKANRRKSWRVAS
jgi:hypothetical protein